MPTPLFNKALLNAKPLNSSDIPDSDLNVKIKNDHEPMSLATLVLKGEEIAKYKAEQPIIWIAPFLTSGSIVLVTAKRGIGKSWFVQQLAVSVSMGMPFMEYDVPHKGKVLLIDGEMRLYDLQFRIGALAGDCIPENLYLLSSELLSKNDISLNINELSCQERVNELINEILPEVIIFDNLSSLRFGCDENANSDLDKQISWFRDLRHKGIAIVVVHHDGKNGMVRGASRIEDIMDYIIDLKKKEEHDDSTAFQMVFTKCRGDKPIPFSPISILIETGSGLEFISSTSNVPHTNQLKILLALNEKHYNNQKSIVEDLKINKGTVSKELQKLEDLGFVTKDTLQLTSQGKSHVTNIFSKL